MTGHSDRGLPPVGIVATAARDSLFAARPMLLSFLRVRRARDKPDRIVHIGRGGGAMKRYLLLSVGLALGAIISQPAFGSRGPSQAGSSHFPPEETSRCRHRPQQSG